MKNYLPFFPAGINVVLFIIIFCFFTIGKISAQPNNFEMLKVADGVYAAIRKETLAFGAYSNNVFIINDTDVIAVDSNLTLTATREMIAALRKITDKPVRYVVHTHWHDDHITGDQAYRDAFPNVEFIAHQSFIDWLPVRGVKNRVDTTGGIPDLVKTLTEKINKNESLEGGALTDEEREAYSTNIKLAEQYMNEASNLPVLMPTITLDDRLTLYRGNRVIDILHVGSGHTIGDIIVHLPKENIVIAGDLVVSPVPYVGGEQSHTGDWSLSLQKMLDLKPAVIIPGHGQIMRDYSYVQNLIRLFSSIKDQTEAAQARGETVEQARKSVNVDDFKKQFVGDSKMRASIWRLYVFRPAVDAAYADAVQQAAKNKQ